MIYTGQLLSCKQQLGFYRDRGISGASITEGTIILIAAVYTDSFNRTEITALINGEMLRTWFWTENFRRYFNVI